MNDSIGADPKSNSIISLATAIQLSHFIAEKVSRVALECLNAAGQKLELKRKQATVDTKKNEWPVIAGKMISFFHNRINAC